MEHISVVDSPEVTPAIVWSLLIKAQGWDVCAQETLSDLVANEHPSVFVVQGRIDRVVRLVDDLLSRS